MTKSSTANDGADSPADAQHVRDLIAGRPPAGADHCQTYLVVVARQAQNAAAVDPAQLRAACGPGTLTALIDSAVVLLIPGIAGEPTERAVRAVAGLMPGRVWLGAARTPSRDVPAAYREAGTVARLAMASRRPPGVYRLDDVLLEYAVMSNEAVAADLADLARPLAEHQDLWNTLTAFLDKDCSRASAARNLFIHRSTLDYRLDRIRKLTGYDPTSTRGAQVLSMALTARAVCSPR